MNGDGVVLALGLPDSARVDRRVPKSLLLEHGVPIAADKRRINEGIEQLRWVAALKPSTIGVAAYQDSEREYLEIAVLRMMLRPAAKTARLVELLHRAVPYPVVAVCEQDSCATVSLAHKRWSLGEGGKTVLDGDVVAVDPEAAGEAIRDDFLAALALDRQPRGSLFALYQGWVEVLFALQAAVRTHSFVVAGGVDRRAARHEALRECNRLEAEIDRLRSAAVKEKQIPRQVELNLEIKRLEAAQAAAIAKL